MRDPKSLSRKRRFLIARYLEDAARHTVAQHPSMHPAAHKFLVASGGNGPLLLTVKNRSTDEIAYFEFDTPFIRVGTDPLCELCINDAEVSSHHAYLQLVEGRLRCFDLASRTGVFWSTGLRSNGNMLPGEEIRIGPFSLVWTLNEFSPPPETQVDDNVVGPHDFAIPAAGLQFLNARNSEAMGQFWNLQHVVTLIGWSPICKIHLDDDSVSRVHCALVRTPIGMWLVDLLGRKGVRINDELAEFARLKEGDVLQIGRYRLSVSYTATASSTINFGPPV